MHKKTLREIAKFASGLIMGDFICGLWFYFGGYLPMTFLGITFGAQTVVAWLVFDALLFAFLVHYGWKMEDRPRTSNEKIFHRVVGIVFAVVALLHLSRVILGLNFVVGTWNAPYWLNGLGAIVTAFLSYFSFHLANRK